MPARPVQVSIDEELLKRIDEDPEARAHGRSAFIRSAVTSYLSVKERREIADRLARAYSGQADALFEEVEDLLEGQTWPNG